jgi:hypothetical protein
MIDSKIGIRTATIAETIVDDSGHQQLIALGKQARWKLFTCRE